MMVELERALAAAYATSLREYLEHGGEAALSRAYEFGRRAAEVGAGTLDLVHLHHRVLAEIAGSGRLDHERLAKAAEFFAEVLAPLEMTLRGYQQANASLIELNTTLEARNREVQLAKTAAEAANAELEAFSYSVAHDLRAPLRGIDGFSQALLEDYSSKLDDEGKGFLRNVRESAQLMGRIIEDLLTLSRVSRSEVSRDPVDLTALAEASIARIRNLDPRRTVEVVVAPGLSAEGDPRLLGVAFDNLLGNAWKFTGKRADARIEIGQIVGARPATFFVRDNGAGFNPAYAHRLFGVFKRLHSQAEFEGTGIGLATVQRVVRRHGGRIWAESQLGAGATFFFTLQETP